MTRQLPALILLLSFSTFALANANWYQGRQLELYAKSATGNEPPAHWIFTVPNQHNLRLEMNLRFPKVVQGKMMLVMGRVILSQGLELRENQVRNEFEGPVLMYQLAIEVLQRAFPLGPSGVRQREVIKQENLKQGIFVKTGEASGDFHPPINIHGMLSRKQDQSIDYELFFSFHRNRQKENLRLYGNWNDSLKRDEFSPNMKLRDWTLHNMGKIKFKKPKTLGELQAMILQAERRP